MDCRAPVGRFDAAPCWSYQFDAKIWTYLSNGNGTFTQFNTAFQGYQMDTDYFWIGDIDGDGLDDLITQNSGTTIYTYKSTGSGTFTLLSSQSVSTNQFNKLQTWAGDFNGDGRTDLLSLKSLKFYTFLSNGNGSYQVSAGFTLLSSQIDVDNIWTGDFNGDGKVDVVSATGAYLRTYLAVGDGTFQLVSFNRSGLDPVLPGLQTKAADFNGDGRTDLVSMSYDGQFYQFFSKGDGNYDYIYYLPPVPTLYTWDNYPRVGDFNGDGKMDILTCRYDATDGNCAGYLPGVQGYLVTLLSKGNGDFTVVEQPTSASVPLYYDWAVWEGDFSGDGKTEVLHQSTTSVKTYNPVGPYPDLLTNITNPFGGTSAITYKPLTDGTVYAKDGGAQAAVYPNVDMQNPTYVVSTLTAGDGIGANYSHNYTYGGAKAHYLGRGNLGFRWMAQVDVGANSKTTTYNKQVFPHIGFPEIAEVDRASDGAPFRETFTQYENLNGYPSAAPTVSFVLPKQVESIEYEGNLSPSRTTRRKMFYDNAVDGNLIRTLYEGDISVTGNGDERDDQTEWIVVNNSSTYLTRPKRQVVYNGDSAAGAALIREKWLYYDGLPYGQIGSFGLLSKEELNGGEPQGSGNNSPVTGKNPVTTFVRDGNVGVVTTKTDARGCGTTSVYEATKTFPQSVTNCLSHQKTLTYDPRFGVPLTETDANGATTTSEYDGFGRVTKSWGPLDSQALPTVSYEYNNWGTPSQQHVKTSRREINGQAGVLWSEEYFDGLGRVDFTRAEGTDATKFIITDTVHDSRNLVIQRSAPYFADANNNPLETIKYVNFTYDILGRQSLVTNPDNSTVITVYKVPGIVEITDERGKLRRKYFDAHGRMTKVDELNSGATYTTTFEYDAAGSLLRVLNAQGHNTRMAYDLLGRKIAMCDPNMGTASGITSCTTNSVGAWVYTYSSAGDLLTQKDAKNQTLTFTYDNLGRPLTKKQGTTSLVTWTYDDPVVLYSKGRVTQIVDQATTTKLTYDIVGRTTQTQRQLLGVWYTMAQSYDGLSRVKTETFPDTETVTYNYNSAGWLQSVHASTGLNYINDIQYNARGQKTQLTYGNNLVTNWTYDANRFWVSNRVTSGNQQNLTYGRDPSGNITSIADAISPTGSRTFGYDDLQRLVSATGNFGPNQSSQNCTYGYSSIGNLENRCGAVLAYNDALHPSAVTYNFSTAKTYAYDANGNMTTRGTQTLTWDIDNRVTGVSISGGGTTLMEYDYSGMRVKKNSPTTGITLFPFQGYEINSSGVVTKFIKIGVESFASKRGTAKLYYHNDHLGSVHTITNESQAQVQLNEYDPWGGVSKTVGNIDPTHRFNGKELDPETGLYYYGGRYYDPEISRFVSPDPFVPSPGNPQSLNRYSYTLNNPQNYIDPSGFFFDKLFKAIGNFFKSIFKNPGVFFASLIVGIATGGIAAAAGAPAFLAAAVGGMAGSMTAAGMTGGNIWQAALIGGIAGGVGGWVGGTYGPVAGTLAGGGTGGALNTAFRGGNFAVNVFSGAISAGIVYGAGKVISAMAQTSGEPHATSDSGMLRYAAASQSTGADAMCDCQYVSGENTWADRFYREYGDSVDITREFFYGSLGKAVTTIAGMKVASAIAQETGTLTWGESLRGLSSGGVANLGRVGSLLSAGTTAAFKTLLVAGALEVGIQVGAFLRAWAVATYPNGYDPSLPPRGIRP